LSEEAESTKCPFCGAPYNQIVSAGVVSLRCPYCGGIFHVTFHVEPEMKANVPRCTNHPEQMAVGICNDCGGSYCGDCLHGYELKGRGESATLYLCPSCLRARYKKNARNYVFSGALCLAVAVIFLGVFPADAWSVPRVFFTEALFLVLGVGMLVYGIYLRSRDIEEPTVEESSAQREEESDDMEPIRI
jgi:hypothetical protein